MAIGWLGLVSAVVFMTLLVIALVLGWGLWADRSGRPRCDRCKAPLVGEGEPCALCAPAIDPTRGEGADAGAELPQRRSEPRPTWDPEDGVLNPGITRTMVKVATVLMVGGLGIRLLGMLEPVGLDLGLPHWLMVFMTLVGGTAAFIGFVVLDLA